MEEDDFESVMLESDFRGYLYEPQYSEEELRQMEQQEAASAGGLSRAGTNWWCLCSRCAATETEIESLCCREFQRCQFLLGVISASDEDMDVCVVDHPSFAPHMDSGVLDTYFRILKIIWKRQPKPAGANGRLTIKQCRLTAYRHFLEWVLQGERLGRGHRVVLPACVVEAIRHRYPAADGHYRGHEEVEDALEEL